MLLTTTLTVHTDLPSYKLRRREAIALTSVLVAVLEVLKHVFLIAEIVTPLQRRSFATKTPRSQPLRGVCTPPLHLSPAFKSLLSTPCPLRKHIQEFCKRGESVNEEPTLSA